MHFIKCTIYAIVILSTVATAYGNENNHLCLELVNATTEEGLPYQMNITFCCEQYVPNENGKCIPVCETPCRFGFCKAPNVCECNNGYEMKMNKCVPICKNKCINGYCKRPGVCGCPTNFELDANNSSLCIPICEPKCPKFSKCIKSIPPNPNRCQCISGFAKNKKSETCEPVCTNKCVNGFCSAPETCGCNKGYELDYTNKTNCKPKCEPICSAHSSCVAPNKCKCNAGYSRNKITDNCDPICRDKITNSRCIAPPNTWTCIDKYQHDRKIDKCVLESCNCNSNGYCLNNKDECECYDGFEKNSTGHCEAHCKPNCKNSICIANNECQCLDGYHKTPEAHICEPNDLCNGKPCENGECLITGDCKCKSGFVKSLSYNGQLQCDKVQTFIGKVMTTILGVPLILATCILIVVCVIAKKKSYNVEEQEMMLIGNH
ncbi:epidermal growth factor-like protein 6 [Calliphora vicina]|uniref:epidermal growth factor-like protein 6 n=1 Tax=Calliphora vicina TaxID=7373 RepID=UPI00325A717A